MTMGVGQQLLGTGFDNATFCVAIQRNPGSGAWGFSRCLGGKNCPWKFLVQGGCTHWFRGQGWTDGLVLSIGGFLGSQCDPSCPGRARYQFASVATHLFSRLAPRPCLQGLCSPLEPP